MEFILSQLPADKQFLHVTEILKRKTNYVTWQWNIVLSLYHLMLPAWLCKYVHKHSNIVRVWSHKNYHNLTDTGRNQKFPLCTLVTHVLMDACGCTHSLCKTVTLWAQNDWNIGLKDAGMNPLYHLCHYSTDSGYVLFF